MNINSEIIAKFCVIGASEHFLDSLSIGQSTEEKFFIHHGFYLQDWRYSTIKYVHILLCYMSVYTKLRYFSRTIHFVFVLMCAYMLKYHILQPGTIYPSFKRLYGAISLHYGAKSCFYGAITLPYGAFALHYGAIALHVLSLLRSFYQPIRSYCQPLRSYKQPIRS